MKQPDRMTELTERQSEIEREINNIAEARPHTHNMALEEMETVLMGELHSIEEQLDKLRGMVDESQADIEAAMS